MRCPMEQSYQQVEIKIKIRHCYTCSEADSTITLIRHPKVDFLVAF
jgi:hypothetical protein